MTARVARHTVCVVFRELPPPSERPPGIVRALRGLGVVGVAVVVAATFGTEPKPSLHGEGLGVLLALTAIVGGIAASFSRRTLRDGRRVAGMLTVSAGGIALAALQPTGAAIGAYAAVVWSMYRSMVKNFDMTIRKQSR